MNLERRNYNKIKHYIKINKKRKVYSGLFICCRTTCERNDKKNNFWTIISFVSSHHNTLKNIGKELFIFG